MFSPFTVTAADTLLYGVDSRGEAPPLLFLNGTFATQQSWRRVVERLDARYRTITFDARGRGRSGRSSDYSLRGAIDDTDRVIDAAALRRPPVLVGHSYGATLAVCYAAEYPDQVGGLVLIDGAHPVSLLDEARKDDVRRHFRRRGRVTQRLTPLGRSVRMTPEQCAEVVIEMDAVNGELAADLAALRCPAVFVTDIGGRADTSPRDAAAIRAAVGRAVVDNPCVMALPTVRRGPTQPLAKDPEVVVAALAAVVQRSEPVGHR